MVPAGLNRPADQASQYSPPKAEDHAVYRQDGWLGRVEFGVIAAPANALAPAHAHVAQGAEHYGSFLVYLPRKLRAC
jgi:hypothetical protein